ncbi:MAG: hypothetical protein O3B08_17435, partial [Proteobacteria bacterium]|nr:hypothetical protein [Pseudomonadota bacterium]
MPVEDRHRIERPLARRHFLAAIGLVGPGQLRGQIRAPLQHLVEDRHGADEAAVPARLRLLYAEQRDDVAAVRMI